LLCVCELYILNRLVIKSPYITLRCVLLFLNALTAVGALRALIDFTNVRRFYSSMGNPLAVKGLTTSKTMFKFSADLDFCRLRFAQAVPFHLNLCLPFNSFSNDSLTSAFPANLLPILSGSFVSLTVLFQCASRLSFLLFVFCSLNLEIVRHAGHIFSRDAPKSLGKADIRC